MLASPAKSLWQEYVISLVLSFQERLYASDNGVGFFVYIVEFLFGGRRKLLGAITPVTSSCTPLPAHDRALPLQSPQRAEALPVKLLSLQALWLP